MTAPGTPSTPGQGGAWRDTTRDGTPVPPDLRWDNRWCLWMSDRAETRWYANGRIYGPYRESRESGADLIPTPTPAPSPVAEVDAGARLPVTADGVRVLPFDEVYHPDWTAPSRLRVWLVDDIVDGLGGDPEKVYRELRPYGINEGDELPEFVATGSYYESDTGYSETVSIPVGRCYSTREALAAALARATRTEGGAS